MCVQVGVASVPSFGCICVSECGTMGVCSKLDARMCANGNGRLGVRVVL